MHKKCGSEVVIDHRDDRTFESDVKEQGDEEFYREQVIPLYSDLYRFLRAFVGDPEAAEGYRPDYDGAGMEENSSAEKEGSGEILAVSDRTQCIVDILYVQSDENYLQRLRP